MTKAIHAMFDGEVFKPEEPVSLAPNTRVVITVTTEEKREGEPGCFLRTAGSLNLEGPADWSERV